MQRMHRQQTEDTENTINQSSGGFSLFNIQWASFATGATAIIVCALLFISFIICCWIRTKNIRRTNTRHAQLLDVLRRPSGRAESVPETDSRFPRPVSSRFPSAQPYSAPDKWLSTPTGWTSVPKAYQLPASSQYGLPQLPFPQFPRLSTTEGTSPSASVGFLAAGGIPSVSSPFPTGHAISWSSGSTASRRSIPLLTLLSPGAPELLSWPERPPVWPPLSLKPFSTILPVLNPARGHTKPPTRTLSSPQSPSTSVKRRST